MKILITGGAGYIGSVLTIKLLRLNHKVTVVDNLFYGQDSLLAACKYDKFDFIYGDAIDEKLIKKTLSSFDVIIPLACLVGAPLCDQKPALAVSTNYGAIKLIDDLRSKDQLVIYPTTNSGYGIGAKDNFCTENSPLNPISLYGQTKVDTEKMLLESGNTISLRLATVFGMSPRMRMDLLVNDFVYRAVKDRFIVLFEEHFRRNYIHIRDVAGVFSFGVDNFSNMKGQSFNVGLSTANLTKMQLCERIKDHVPTFEIYVSAIGKDPDQRDYVVSNEKIESLGWAPRYTLDNGINELVKGYQIVKPNIYANA